MSGPATRDLAVYRGDVYSHRLEFFEADETTPFNLSGSTWRAQIRRRPQRTAELLATFAVDAADQAAGVLVLSLAAADTVDLPTSTAWDLERTSSGVVTTLLRGTITASGEVSHG